MFYSEEKRQVLLFDFYTDHILGYDRINNCFTLFNSDNTQSSSEEVNSICIYTCNVELVDGKYISGGNWGNYSIANTSFTLTDFSYSNLKFIYGNTNIYPCYNDIIVTKLPVGRTWSDNIIIAYDKDSNEKVYCFIPEIYDSNYVWSNYDYINNFLCYRETYDKSVEESVVLSGYVFNYLTNEWEFVKTGTSTSMYPLVQIKYDELIFFHSDIFKCTDGSIIYKGMGNFFSGFWIYNSFPYILNSVEDLAKGDDDVVVMPR